MKTRSWLVVLLVIAVLAAGCAAPAAPAAGGAAGKPLRVAVVMPSATTDMAFSQSMFEALKGVQKESGRREGHGAEVLGEHVQGA